MAQSTCVEIYQSQISPQQRGHNTHTTMTQKPQQTAQTARTASTTTTTLITAKCKISDLHSDILDAMDLIFGDHTSDERFDEIYEALIPIRDLVDRYLIWAIDEKIGRIGSTEF